MRDKAKAKPAIKNLMRGSMKTNIKYNAVNILSGLIGLFASLTFFIVLLSDGDAVDSADSYLWGVILYGAFFLISAILLLDSIKNIQWFDIASGYITVYSPFGIIQRVHLSKIKKVFKTNAAIWSIRMLVVRREHIVLCLNKSVTKNSINDAYNRKKKPYIIVPYTEEARDLICSEYKKICGEELIIK